MSELGPLSKLRDLLAELGVPTLDGREPTSASGFPLSVPLADGGTLVFDLPQPGVLASLDPQQVGGAIVDPLGGVRSSWGLAKRSLFLKASSNVLTGQIGPLFEAAFQGDPGAVYLEGLRYFAAVATGSPCRDVFVLVTNAQDERVARRQASRSAREAAALKRLGRVLTMNLTTQSVSVAAVHEVVSAAELAAALLWTYESEPQELRLAAHVGANRQGTGLLQRLFVEGAPTCAAELVAASRQPFNLGSVLDHVITSELEARFCYLKPGAICVQPLVIGSHLLGVLEMIGRDGDPHFAECQELFQTIAEHLALALNSAMLFESMERMAWHDPVTGIANHRALHEFLRVREAEASREGGPIGIVMIDVDNFRSFNEEEGHETGDAVLRMVAEALKASVREYDLAARYGGEEFTAILPGADRETTLSIAERIRKRVEAVPVETRSGRVRHVTVSVGCAFYPESAIDAAALLRAADIALFEAKRRGRNLVVAFEGELAKHVRDDEQIVHRAWRWVAKSRRAEVEERLLRLEPTLNAIASSLNLSSSQARILRALAIVRDAYEEAVASQNRRRLRSMEGSDDFRLLLPSLSVLGERFDGSGPKSVPGQLQPLLARILSVVLALDDDCASVLLTDPGRFDPEIVMLIGELESAA